MYTVKLMNEFLHGPIWIYDDDDVIISKYPLISDDPKLQILDEEAGTLFNSFYDFDVGDEPCVFDDEGYKAAFPKMKELIEKIKQRLNEILIRSSINRESIIVFLADSPLSVGFFLIR